MNITRFTYPIMTYFVIILAFFCFTPTSSFGQVPNDHHSTFFENPISNFNINNNEILSEYRLPNMVSNLVGEDKEVVEEDGDGWYVRVWIFWSKFYVEVGKD